jgi:hypothetical protein
MDLKDTIKKKDKLITKAEDKLLDGIKTSERVIFNKILSILSKLAQKEGKLEKEAINNKFFNTLTKSVLRVIRKSTLQKKIDDFLPNFEKIEDLNSGLYKGLTGKEFTKKIKSEIGVYRKITIETIVDNLLGEQALKANYITPIRNILFKGVALKQNVKDVEKELTTFIKGNKNQAGQFTRYVKQIAMDAINQHDGQINDIARDTYQLDGFIYTGSIIETSRDNCEHLTGKTSLFSDLEVKKGMYRVEDIPKIIRRLDKGKGSGWNPATTPETFAQYRGGYNCRHQVIYIPLPKED